MIHSQNELQSFFEMCCDSLRRSKAAQPFLQEHGLSTDLEVGFNSGKYHFKQNEAFIKAWIQAKLLRLGNRGSDYQVWARRCLIFPLKNRKHEIVGVYGRSISNDAKAKHFYQMDRQGLYPSYPNQETKILILVESVIDAAILGQLALGLENYAVLALDKAKTFNEEHRLAVKEPSELEEIIFMFSDLALAEEIEKLRVNVKMSQATFPEGEDAISFHLNRGDQSEEGFQDLINQRQDIEALETKQEIEQGVLHESKTGSILFSTDVLQLEILGGIRMEGLDKLQVSLKVGGNEKRLRHRLDLYNDDQVEKLSRKCSEKLGVNSTESYEVLQQLTDALEKYRQDILDNKNAPTIETTLSPAERESALEYLSAPDLMKRSGEDLGKTGIIGEELNRLTMLIVMSSRKRPRPLHVMNMASSGQGKTHLLKGVSACIPEADKIEMTSLSDNALYYFGEDELKYKLMMIEDLDGAGNVLYPLRELQSKRRLRKRVAIKDERGKTKTEHFEVNGPVCIAGCTTKEQLYEDNANRSFLLYLDESAEQDKKIMDYQRLKSAGKIKSCEEKSIQSLLQSTQRVLRDITVRNPYAEYLNIPNAVFKPRRTNAHYLDFIEAVTFYHQFQREIKTDETTGEKYIETTLEDIRWANTLLEPVLLRKSDELTGACRRFYEKLKYQLEILGQSNFRSGEMRLHFRIAHSTFNRYLLQLRQNGFLKIVGGNRFHRGFEYEIVSYTEYQELQEEVSSVLDEVYKKIEKLPPFIDNQ